MLQDGLLQHNLDRFKGFQFAKKQLIINNVDNLPQVRDLARRNYPDFDVYCYEDDRETILDYFEIDHQQAQVGIFYSMMHYIGLYYCDCDYLFHVDLS